MRLARLTGAAGALALLAPLGCRHPAPARPTSPVGPDTRSAEANPDRSSTVEPNRPGSEHPTQSEPPTHGPDKVPGPTPAPPPTPNQPNEPGDPSTPR